MGLRKLVILLLALLVAGLAPAANAAGGLLTGFNQDPQLTGSSASVRSNWIDGAVAEGAGIVRVNVDWSGVAPAVRPPGFVASNPATPGYDWSSVDPVVRALASRGLQVLLNITKAPSWAEGPNQPAGGTVGTWEPNAAQFGQFAEAAARRYDGRFPDPSDPGSVLPRVRFWQAWNEPNLSYYLAPQWSRTSRGLTPASPVIYGRMLNAFYVAVKGVAESNVVLSAGMAPYGDSPGGQRIPPVAFDRSLLCLGATLRPKSCSAPAHLDVLAQSVYPIEGPLWHALDLDDVAVPDLYKVARVLNAAEHYGTVLPRGRKAVWVTELGWDSDPPNPQGVPIAEQARWYEQALYVLWSQGVSTVLLLQLEDSPTPPGTLALNQTGLLYVNGQPKPAAMTFRFPFVTSRINRSRVLAWGRAPVRGLLVIERSSTGGWKVVARFAVGGRQVFEKTLSIRGRAVLRARVGSQTSLIWTQSG